MQRVISFEINTQTITCYAEARQSQCGPQGVELRLDHVRALSTLAALPTSGFAAHA